MSQLIVQVSKDVAYALLHKEASTHDSRTLLSEADRLGIVFHALHPNVEDSELQSYFIAELSDSSIVSSVINDLMKNPVVEAAYIKPEDELP